MIWRNYEPERDRAAVLRIWHETGWIPPGKEEMAGIALSCGRPLVAELDGAAECMVHTAPGTMRYLDQELPFSGVTAVATSRIARQQGLAGRLTALAVALDAAEGALVSGLGMFEQGFYDRLGFGTGPYEHFIAFDPTHLQVPDKARVPRRLGTDDWALVHAARLARPRGHGALNLFPPEMTRMEIVEHENGFGLGYCDGPQGELTHHIWFTTRSVEHGPYSIMWMTFQNAAQFRRDEALDTAASRQFFLLPRYLRPDGYDGQREYGEAWAEATRHQDLNPEPHFAQATAQRTKANSLAGTLVIESAALLCYTLANAWPHRARYALTLAGLLLMLAGLVMAVRVEWFL